jgi:hypothetical protein
MDNIIWIIHHLSPSPSPNPIVQPPPPPLNCVTTAINPFPHATASIDPPLSKIVAFRDGSWTPGYGYPRVLYSVDMDID